MRDKDFPVDDGCQGQHGEDFLEEGDDPLGLLFAVGLQSNRRFMAEKKPTEIIHSNDPCSLNRWLHKTT